MRRKQIGSTDEENPQAANFFTWDMSRSEGGLAAECLEKKHQIGSLPCDHFHKA
jgi:hypothetical protein